MNLANNNNNNNNNNNTNNNNNLGHTSRDLTKLLYNKTLAESKA